MASVVSLAGTLGLLLVSALPEVLGDGRSPDHRARRYQRGLLEGGWDCPWAPNASCTDSPLPSSSRRRRPGRPWGRGTPAAVAAVRTSASGLGPGALPLRALYTAAAVAFIAVQVFAGAGLTREIGDAPALNLDKGRHGTKNKTRFPDIL